MMEHAILESVSSTVPVDDEIVNCLVEAGLIQAIDKESVHRICSGQVVLTLATAVKELVENSIDAGATTVDIKLKEYGSESIEVTDNGSGVEEKNFAGLTLKHHTSKLLDFSDLVNVQTFGFRGEALSSLCALSNMSVTTRHASVAVGTKLEFDGNGKIISKSPVPRQQGTTVILQNLFHTLPVRHKEFLRNLKKDFGKMVQVLNAYCIVSTGVRITCANQTCKGSKSVVISTNGNATVRDNIANVFGPKQLQSIVPFIQCHPTAEICSDFGLPVQSNQMGQIEIEGFVSKCEHGQGRSSADRQFIFINKRPCDSSKVLKLMNEVYHSYNKHQYPFIVLLISMARESVDVNVTPDKRQIFLEGEKLLLATVKASLVSLYQTSTSVLRVQALLTQSQHPVTSVNSSVKSPNRYDETFNSGVKNRALMDFAKVKRSFSVAFDKAEISTSSLHTSQPEKQQKLNKRHSLPVNYSPDKGSIKSYFICTDQVKNSVFPLETESKTAVTVSTSPSTKDCFSEEQSQISSSVVDNVFLEHFPVVRERPSVEAFDETDSLGANAKTKDQEEIYRVLNSSDSRLDASCTFSPHSPSADRKSGSQQQLEAHSTLKMHNHEILSDSLSASKRSDTGHEGTSEESLDQSFKLQKFEDRTVFLHEHRGSSVVFNSLNETQSPSMINEYPDLKSGENHDDNVEQESDDGAMVTRSLSVHTCLSGSPSTAALSVTITHLDTGDDKSDADRPETLVPFSFQRLRQCLASIEADSKRNREQEGFSRSFRAKINPSDNQSAEEELQREISKDMFETMEVLGQFNLGFIITRHKEDLFIVDQHATDEKYNFETLQRKTILQCQQLIQPQCLELTASNEVILMDNLDIFRKNGFDFVIDSKAPPTQRVKLKSTPVSKNWSFGKDDIEELIFMLTDSPGVMCRPSRVRMMFASRACRKSVMIGTALNKSEMKKLLCHMGEIEQPWNCPHGRPTMRHLICLRMLPR